MTEMSDLVRIAEPMACGKKRGRKYAGRPLTPRRERDTLSLDHSVYWEVTMRVAKDDVDVKLQIPGAVIRQRTNFGNASGYDHISGEYFTLAAGVDTTPLFQGLDDNLCQCPHWGFVLKGRLTTTDGVGQQESVATNDLFYWPPGHNVRVDEDAEIVMFSPQHAHTHVIDHMIRKVNG